MLNFADSECSRHESGFAHGGNHWINESLDRNAQASFNYNMRYPSHGLFSALGCRTGNPKTNDDAIGLFRQKNAPF